MKSIQATEKSVKGLFGKQYGVDSYQREYKWQKKQVEDLLDDLLEAFGENYADSHEQNDVKGYDQYFLGSILVGEGKGNGKDFIIDGQQRLTTLTLLLICLRRKIQSKEENDPKNKKSDKVGNLIRSEEYGNISFILDVDDRASCLEALYDGEHFDISKEDESVQNLVARHEQINEQMEDMPNEKTLFFLEWLIEKVYLVVITASSKDDYGKIIFADRIFQTMNDRGLNLTPTEMLKGFLLSNIQTDDRRKCANKTWKKQVERLNSLDKATDAEVIKSWLRGRYAESTDDFNEIGSQFHRWVRDKKTDILGLEKSSNYEKFIETDFKFYAKRFHELRQAIKNFKDKPWQECVYYLSQHPFTLQYPILLASLKCDDQEEEYNRKLRVVSAYLDIMIHRRIGNRKDIAERSMRELIFKLILEIRNKNACQIAELLTNKLKDDRIESTIEKNFVLHGMNRKKVHRILARITDFIERKSKKPSHYTDYFKGFQIEHIWREEHDEERQEEFPDKRDFLDARNKIGGLILLPSKDNGSYGDKHYKDKRDYYLTQNMLAASLHETCYESKPGFRDFREVTCLEFQPHSQFTVDDLEKRQDLYRKIAEHIWNPDRLRKESVS